MNKVSGLRTHFIILVVTLYTLAKVIIEGKR